MKIWGEAYLARLRECAERMGRDFAEISDRDRSVRLVEPDARLVEEAFAEGVLEVTGADQVQTLDPLQDATSLLTGDPAQPQWSTLAQMAGYVELLHAGYPVGAVRFATPEAELGLDLAAVNDDGQVLLVGVARAEPMELTKLEALVSTLDSSSLRRVRGVPVREAQHLAHQLCATRAPYLWLVAAGSRRLFRVRYGTTLRLTPVKYLPLVHELWPYGFEGTAPRIVAVDSETVAG